MPLTRAPISPDTLTDLPESVLAAVRRLPAPPAAVRDGHRPRYARDVIRRALSNAARSLDATPEGRHGFLRALGEFEAHLLDRDERIDRLRRDVRAARVIAQPVLPILPATDEAVTEARVTNRWSVPRGLAGWGCALSLAVLIACRHHTITTMAGELDRWLVLMLGMVVYAGWDVTVRAAVGLTAPYVSRGPARRVAMPIGFALVVVVFGLALVAGFDSLVLVGSVVGRPAS
jgi:hypothetical protein